MSRTPLPLLLVLLGLLAVALPGQAAAQQAAAQRADTTGVRAAPALPTTAPPEPSPRVASSADPLARVRAAAAALGPAPGPYPPLDPRLAGVVWQPPAARDAALSDLVAMRRAGVRAVRTPLLEDETLLAAGDLLGLAFYQDLPPVDLPAAVLRAQAPAMEALLAEALVRARPYASARHFGLARGSDTSTPAARPYFERLARRARADGAEGTRVYYVTRFPQDDRCHETVDFVLLDARDADPVALLLRWRERHGTPAGLASFGVGVVPGRVGGWRTPGTEAAQARALENELGALLALDEPPVVAFAFRWQDAAGADAERDPQAETAGLVYGWHDAEGRPRPARAVAEGFFTGTQRVFAFDAGRERATGPGASPLILTGWLLALALGLLYAGVPRFSTLVPRVLARRDLYREAVQRGYDLPANMTAALAAVVALSAGIVGAGVLGTLAQTDALSLATASWSLEDRLRLAALMGRPLLLAAGVAALYVAWLVLNVAWLYALSGRRRLRSGQALSLVVWSRWGWIPLMAAATILATLPLAWATVLAPVLLFGGLGLEVIASYRMLYDFSMVLRVPPVRALGLGFLVPLGLLGAGLAALFLAAQAETEFLWHLATRR
ncbi:MAG: hypothetical protein ACK41D_05520 [Rubricoccaceae bacterium]